MSIKTIINTRADLDAIAGTTAHAEFIAHLKGTLTRTADVRNYPADYDRTQKPRTRPRHRQHHGPTLWVHPRAVARDVR